MARAAQRRAKRVLDVRHPVALVLSRARRHGHGSPAVAPGSVARRCHRKDGQKADKGQARQQRCHFAVPSRGTIGGNAVAAIASIAHAKATIEAQPAARAQLIEASQAPR